MTAQHPPISAGTRVRTTQANTPESEWQEEARSQRKWGIQGKIISHSDSHGLCYLVEHDDKSSGWYDPSEFEILKLLKGGVEEVFGHITGKSDGPDGIDLDTMA